MEDDLPLCQHHQVKLEKLTASFPSRKDKIYPTIKLTPFPFIASWACTAPPTLIGQFRWTCYPSTVTASNVI